MIGVQEHFNAGFILDQGVVQTVGVGIHESFVSLSRK